MKGLLEVNEDITLIKLLKAMIDNGVDLVSVMQNNKSLGIVSFENILLYMLESGERLNDILNRHARDFTTPPRYILNHEVDHDELRRVILSMESYEPLFVVENDHLVAVITLGDMLSSLSFVKPLLCEAVTRSRKLGTLVAPNTTIKGCVKRMIRDNSKQAVVHRKGRVLGLINQFDIMNCLISSNTLDHIRLGIDDYFFHATCSTIMRRNFEYLLAGNYERAYQMLLNKEHLVVLDSHSSKRLVKFISVNSAFILLKEALKRHF